MPVYTLIIILLTKLPLLLLLLKAEAALFRYEAQILGPRMRNVQELQRQTQHQQQFKQQQPLQQQRLLTFQQLLDCYSDLDSACSRRGFQQLFRASTKGALLNQWKPSYKLQDKLRLVMVQLHSKERPREKLALCFLVKSFDIMEPAHLRQDAACMTLRNLIFRMESDVRQSQKILCNRNGANYDRIYFLCSRSFKNRSQEDRKKLTSAETNELVADTTVISGGGKVLSSSNSLGNRTFSLSLPPSLTSLSSSSKSSDSRVQWLQRSAKLTCVLMWLAAVLLSAVLLLSIVTLLCAVLRKASFIVDSTGSVVSSADEKGALVLNAGPCNMACSESQL